MPEQSTLPVSEGRRIESLDLLRGFALLGILLLNIIGFGFISTAYSNPSEAIGSAVDLWVWATVELFGEGAMRCLFSILFGAGVVLFTTGASGKSGGLHYKRNFWLLVFGLVDGYLLLWNGDILLTYALAGFLLYPVRHTSAKRLMWVAGALIALMSLMYGGMQFGMGMSREAALAVEASHSVGSSDAAPSQETQALAKQWNDFSRGFNLEPAARAEELAQRRHSYASAADWNFSKNTEMITFVVPLFLLWDALAMMLLGMALYKYGVLQGDRPTQFYWRLMILGLGVGLAVNASEVHRAVSNDFALLSVFAQAQATYQIGRLGVALGYIGLLVLILHKGCLSSLRARLAAVGRMALTNYLMHSVICLFLFTGAGLALVGTLSRAEVYLVVFAIWAFQLLLSPWWLVRYKFGPVEWLWRGLTYGKFPEFRRNLTRSRTD